MVPIPIVRRREGGQPDSVTPEGYGILCAVFDEWVKNDVGRPRYRVAEMGLSCGGEAPTLLMALTCGRVLVVEQDGVFLRSLYVNASATS